MTTLVPEVRGGRWSVDCGNGFALDDLRAVVETETSLFESENADAERTSDGTLRFSFDGLVLRISIARGDDGLVEFRSALENRSGKDVRVRAVGPVCYDGDWGAEGAFSVRPDATVHVVPAERCYGFEGERSVEDGAPIDSCWFSSFFDPGPGRAVAIGIAERPGAFVRIRVVPLLAHTPNRRVLRWRATFDLLSGARGVLLPAGATRDLGGLLLCADGGSHIDALGRLARAVARRTGAEPHPAPAGWCSWYAGYADAIEERDCLANLEAARDFPGLDVFQIDDGWTEAEGTRRFGPPRADGRKFPSGMTALAARIRRSGLRPGLWLRPFRGWDAGPEWSRGRCIDAAHPDARAWLRELASRVTREWGYDYLKLDFLSLDLYGRMGMELLETAPARVMPSDGTVTNVEIFTAGLEALREGAGSDVHLVGCNCLLGPSIGLVDSFRIGDDVAADNWGRTIAMGLRSVAPMRWLHGAVWSNDPDCILVHEPMPPEGARLWATAVALSGGAAIVGSPLHTLSSERAEILRRVLPLPTATPSLACERRGDTELWYAAVDDDVSLAALFAPGDASVRSVPRAAYPPDEDARHIYDFWSDRYLGRLPRDTAFEAGPRSCRLLHFTRARPHPHVVGCDGHVWGARAAGVGERYRPGERLLELRSTAARTVSVVLYIPPGFRTDGGETVALPLRPGAEPVVLRFPSVQPPQEP